MANNQDTLGPDPSLPSYDGVPPVLSGLLVVQQTAPQAIPRSDGEMKCGNPVVSFIIDNVPVDPSTIKPVASNPGAFPYPASEPVAKMSADVPIVPIRLFAPVAKFNPHHDDRGRFSSADGTQMPSGVSNAEVSLLDLPPPFPKDEDTEPSPLMKDLVYRDGVHTVADLRPGDVLTKTTMVNGHVGEPFWMTVEGAGEGPIGQYVVARYPSKTMETFERIEGTPGFDVRQKDDPPMEGSSFNPKNPDDILFAQELRYMGSMPEPETPYTEKQYQDQHKNSENPPTLFSGGFDWFEDDNPENFHRVNDRWVKPSVRKVGFEKVLPPVPDFPSGLPNNDAVMWSHFPEAARQIADAVDAIKKKGISSSALEKIQVYTDVPSYFDSVDPQYGKFSRFKMDLQVLGRAERNPHRVSSVFTDGKYMIHMNSSYLSLVPDQAKNMLGLQKNGENGVKAYLSGFSPDYDGHAHTEAIFAHEVGHCLLYQVEEDPKKLKEFMDRVLGPECLNLKYTKLEERRMNPSEWYQGIKREIVAGASKTWKIFQRTPDKDHLEKGNFPTPIESRGIWKRGDSEKVAKKVSSYATKNFHEMVAEAFAEGVMSQHPRKAAKAVVKLLAEYTK
jgi:hypothetical protein